MEARSSGAERSVRTKRSERMSVSEGWNARPERSEGNARNKLLTFIFPIVIFLVVTIKVTTILSSKNLGGIYGTLRSGGLS